MLELEGPASSAGEAEQKQLKVTNKKVRAYVWIAHEQSMFVIRQERQEQRIIAKSTWIALNQNMARDSSTRNS